METEYDDLPYPVSPSIVGDRNILQVEVKHDLGDRTLVVVILLAIVIGACCLVMGRNLAKQDQLDDHNRELAARVQVQNNQNARIEAQLEEINHARR